ncbi:ATP-binding protein [Streptomyces sp. NPDC049881]|uniref:ATP-binding protein n=1 Tax=Streptomyces sp. NPDC049881 TaxID=3155778 RepID=UPI0034184EDD
MQAFAFAAVLEHTPNAAPAARCTVRSCLRAWRLDENELADDACLVATELVANAVQHGAPLPSRRAAPGGAGLLVLVLSVEAERLVIAVEDGAPQCLPVERRPGDEDEHGRGLALVAALAAERGVEQPSGRRVKRVWAALPLAPSITS